ncbi:exodeoxyribonuclease V subunit alpha [Lysobacter olei]
MSLAAVRSGFHFQRDPRELAEVAWRPLDRALWRWVRAHGGSAALADAAAWTSLADGHGDTAMPLLGEAAGRHGMPVPSEPAVAALRQEPLVQAADAAVARLAAGDGAPAAPFVIDDAGRFYLWRNFRQECEVSAQVRARRNAHGTAPKPEAGADVDRLFQGDASDAVQAQRRAVAQVPGRRLFVLTGGPGTGKTTTVLRMLLMLQRQRGAALSIAAAAPTGKAAQRLVQSLRQGKERLVTDGALPPDWQPLCDAVPDTEALTLHRLLGYDPHRGVFRRGPRDPLPADVVVVDEASMVDLGMLHALMAAVRPDATLILVGDADQLTSVGAGSVLMDLVAVMERDGADDVVRLEHSFRAERHLVPINQAVRAGDANAFDTALRDAAPLARHRAVRDERALAVEVRRWVDLLAEDTWLRPTLDLGGMTAGVGAEATETVLRALRALSQRQLLCALREDAFGAAALNAAIERGLRHRWDVADGATWYPGRAVLVTRNDYDQRLFNGDVGLCLADADGHLRVWFETVGADGQPSVRGLSPNALPAHDSAFAVTIHKSQGSEYAHAAVVLPPDAGHRILSRQLLYTGVSRAKQQLEVWGAPECLAAALARPIRRAGGLVERLLAGAPGVTSNA